jgi:hypothetical protein
VTPFGEEIWQQALDDALFVREMLAMARQFAPSDPVGAIGCVSDALVRIENLRSRATQSAALLGAVLFYGIEIEVRLSGIKDVPASCLAAVIAAEVERCNKLISAIATHLNSD